jgi:hypothetical protein
VRSGSCIKAVAQGDLREHLCQPGSHIELSGEGKTLLFAVLPAVGLVEQEKDLKSVLGFADPLCRFSYETLGQYISAPMEFYGKFNGMRAWELMKTIIRDYTFSAQRPNRTSSKT